jgi:nitroreductase
MISAAENEGVGACWVAAYDPVLLKEALNPGENQVIFGIIPFGYPKQGFRKTSIKKRKSLSEIVDFL